MTAHQRHLIQTSFAQLVPQSEYAAELFYRRFFDLAPEVESLFKSDLKTQGVKLFQVISFVVLSLDNLSELLPVVQDLGRRHVWYGAQEAHYEAVGEALLWTINQILQHDYSPEIHTAWSDLYGMLAEAMKQAARQTD
ncbi:MAG: globin family protein [Spirosomataceae bacterium]